VSYILKENMKSNASSGFQSFDFATRAKDLINNKQVQEFLAQPGTKERLTNYLESGSVAGLIETDRPLVEIIVSLISIYALQTAFEQCKSDEVVRQYMGLIERMQNGENLQQEMIELVPKIPAEFKDAVRTASNHAQKVLIGLIKSA